MRIDGSYHCGNITFEAEADPGKTSVCHCTDCQTMSGSAFRVNVRVPAQSFRLLSGAPARYLKTTAESGNKRVQAFCPNCGSPVYATTPDDNPTSYTLRVCTLRQRAQFMPSGQNWFRSALPWVTKLAGVPYADKGGL